jgi:ATP-dependent Clp protease adaptor protein ClpS
MSTTTLEPAVAAAVEAPAPARERETKQDSRPQKQPRYHVVLWNDDDHTYQYVIAMLQQLFGHPPERGFQLAKEVDAEGRVIVLTTTREHAELKRDQIHSFGADRLLARSKGAMKASIEPEPA